MSICTQPSVFIVNDECSRQLCFVDHTQIWFDGVSGIVGLQHQTGDMVDRLRRIIAHDERIASKC